MLGLDVIGFIMALSLVRPAVNPEHIAEVDETKFLEVIRQGLALRFFRIATFSGIVSAFIFAVGGFRGPYQLLLGIPVIWFGIYFGIGRVFAALLLAYSGKIHKLIGDVYSFQRIQIVLNGAMLLTLGLITNPWVVVVVFVVNNALSHGLSQVDTGYQLDVIRNHKFKATLLSAGNQIQNVFSMLAVGLMGIAIEHFGYQYSFLVFAIVFLVIQIPLHIYTYRNRPIVG